MRSSLAVLAVFAVLPTRAHADPGWSDTPRWELPARPRVDCPGRRANPPGRLESARDVRCPAELARPAAPPGPATAAPSPEPLPPMPPPRAQRPGAPTRQLPPWAILGSEIEPPTRAVAPARPSPADPPTLDAGQIMALDPGSCIAELEHQADFTRVSPHEAPEVAQPIRVTALAGVAFVIPWSHDLASDHHAIWDCRLAVAMLPLARWLATRGVTEVHYFSVLRRGTMAKRKPRSQHNRGLAIDVLGLQREGEERKDVEDHYPRGMVDNCPVSVRGDATARLYANLVCAAYQWRLMHTILTPDHDRAHENHLHLDVKAGMPRPVDPFVSFAPRGRRKGR